MFRKGARAVPAPHVAQLFSLFIFFIYICLSLNRETIILDYNVACILFKKKTKKT